MMTAAAQDPLEAHSLAPPSVDTAAMSSFWNDHLGARENWPSLELPPDPDVVHRSSKTDGNQNENENENETGHAVTATDVSLSDCADIDLIVYLTAFEIVLKRFTAQPAVLLGVNRAKDGSNVIPLLLQDQSDNNAAPHEAFTLRQLLARRGETWNAAVEHSSEIDHSFKIVGHTISGHKLQTMFHFCESLDLHDTHERERQLDLEFYASPKGVRVQIRDSLWTQRMTQTFLDCYMELLSSWIHDSQASLLMPVTKFNILPPIQASNIAAALTGEYIERDMTLMHQFFEQTVDSHPNKIALRMMDETMTYAQLEEQSNKIANYLVNSCGVYVEDCVGLLLPRGFDQISALLGVLKAGCAYVALDDTYPEGRIRNIVEDCKMVLCISTKKNNLIDRVQDCSLLAIEHIIEATLPTNRLKVPIAPHNMCYLMYTSGSTGKPKGVQIEHQGTANMGHSIIQEWPASNGWQDNFLLTSRLTWDVSVSTLVYSFGTGGTVCLVPPEVKEIGPNFSMLLQQMKVTRLFCTPGLFQFINLSDGTFNLRHVEFIGDVLSPNLVKAMRSKDLCIVNSYGPTECSVYVTRQTITDSDPSLHGRKSVPLGKPFANTRLYILDKSMNPVPPGVSGELYIAGAHLGRGYSRDEENRGVFIPNPFEEECAQSLPFGIDASRLYRTGDLVRLLPEGSLDFIGRIKSGSSYIKLRGFRMELGEISSVLETHDGVDRALVLVDESRQQLLAFVLLNKSRRKQLCSLSSSKLDDDNEKMDLESELRQLCRSHLVDYMIPSKIVLLEDMPLTANGKVDKNRLIESVTNDLVQEDDIILPENLLEEKLVSFFSAALGRDKEKISVIADIFNDFGMNSLMVAQLVAELRKHGLSGDLSVQDAYTNRTIRNMSSMISGNLHDFSVRPSLLEENDGFILSDTFDLLTHPVFLRRLDNCRDRFHVSVDDEECYPLTRVQRRMLLAHQLDPESGEYNIPFFFRLEDELGLQRVEKAFQALMRLHKVLCTKYIGDAESPETAIGVVDLSLADNFRIIVVDEASDQYLRSKMVFDAFSISTGPCLRAFYIPSTRDVCFVIHHISFDGGSISVLTKQLKELYRDNAWKPMGKNLNYIDFAWKEFSKEVKGGPPLDASFWIEHLGLREIGDLPLLELPKDPDCISDATSTAVSASADISKLKLDVAIVEFSSLHNVTPFILFLCVFEITVKRFSSQDDLIVGIPINLRPATFSNAIGMFVNTVALRLQDTTGKKMEWPKDESNDDAKPEDEHESFLDLLLRRARFWDLALSHCDIPYDLVSQHVSGREGAFQAMFNYLDDLENPSSLEDRETNEQHLAMFDMEFTVDNSKLEVKVRESIFTQVSAKRFLDCYIELLSTCVYQTSSQLPLSMSIVKLDILPPSQADFVNTALTGKILDCPMTLMHQFFEKGVDSHPNKIALRMMNETMTYAEVEAQSNQLANYLLQNCGVQVEDCVGILLPLGFGQIISVLGILKAGCAYVALDDTYPKGRIHSIVDDSKMVACISTKHNNLHSCVQNCSVSVLEDIMVESLPSTRPDVAIAPVNLCYIVYTSGSTGKPKGCQIEHQGVSNMGHSIIISWPPSDSGHDNLLLTSWLTWDVSVSTMVYSFGTGGTLCLVPPEMKELGPNFATLLEAMEITRLFCTPGLFQFLNLPKETFSLRNVECGGDVCLPSLVKSLRAKGISVTNAYGPTECSVYATRHPITDSDRCLSGSKSVAIGKPVPNTRLYVLDKWRNRVPPGVPGELYIAGAHLGRGYTREEDNHGVFVPNPFEAECVRDLPFGIDASRLYRTGDLVRLLPEGSLDFIGRIKSGSSYIKLRGFRMELGEISSVLDTHDQVDRSLVLVDEPRQQLIAFVLMNKLQKKNLLSNQSFEMDDDNEKSDLGTELLQLCSSHLVDYMIPSKIVVLGEMPLDANGKVDRKALIASVIHTLPHGGDFSIPSNSLEERLVSLFSSLVGIDKQSVSLTADIFDNYGVNSLMIAQMVAELRKQGLASDLSMRDAFEAHTLRNLSLLILENSSDLRVLSSLSNESPSSVASDISELRTHPDFIRRLENCHDSFGIPINDDEYYPLTRVQRRMLLAQRMDPESGVYNISVALKLRSGIDVQQLEKAFQSLMRRHKVLCTKYIGDGASRDTTVGLVDLSLADNFRIIVVEGAVEKYQREKMIFDPLSLSNGESVRAFYSPSTHDVCFVIHHIAFDGGSISVLAMQLEELCHGNGLERTGKIMPDYIDYAWNEFEEEIDPGLALDSGFWIEHLGLSEGDLPILRLQRDPNSKSETGSKAVSASVDISKLNLNVAVAKMSRAYKVTPVIIFLCVFEVVVKRFTGQDDLVVGVPLNLRPLAYSNAIGMFVNTIALRLRDANYDSSADVDHDEVGSEKQDEIREGNESFLDLLLHRASLWDSALYHGKVPYDLVAQKVRGGHGIFQSIFNYRNDLIPQEEVAVLGSEEIDDQPENTMAMYDIDFTVDNSILQLKVRESIFTKVSVERFLDCYVQLLSDITKKESPLLLVPLQRVSVLTENQSAFIDQHLTGPSRQGGEKLLMHQFFEQTVDSHPNEIALRMMDETMTYAQLEEQSNKIANYLVDSCGVHVEDCVGILLPWGFGQIIALLGILKAGCAYVAMDDTYPEGRIRDIVEDCKMVACISTKYNNLSSCVQYCVVSALEEIMLEDLPSRRPEVPIVSGNLCYILYTSGSTGKPKGVQIEHRGISNLCHRLIEDWPPSNGLQDNMLLTSRLTWDVSVATMMNSFGIVGTLCLVPPEMKELGPNFATLLEAMEITRLFCTPGLFQFLNLSKETFSLRHVECAGDVLLPSLVKSLRAKGICVGNAYGPTECSVYATRHTITDSDRCLSGSKSVAIGKPFPNTRLYVLDKWRNQVPPGVPGELYIAGAHLGRGYTREEDNHGVFVPNPFEAECVRDLPFGIDASRLYRTGDLVRLLPEGSLDFIGRIKSGSSYIKLRGFRMELGEISSVLDTHDQVDRSLVLVDEPRQQLIAFVLMNKLQKKNLLSNQSLEMDDDNEKSDLGTELLQLCSSHLVDYMIPSKIVVLEEMPLDVNGKVDRETLLASASNTVGLGESSGRPTNALEEKLAHHFSSVMGISKESTSMTTDIFSTYGMNSLKAAQFVSELRRSNDSDSGELSIRNVYEAPTLRQLAMIINAKSNVTDLLEDEANNLKDLFVHEKAEATEDRWHYPIITTTMKLAALVIDVALLGTISYYPILLLSRVPFGIENFVPWILYFDLGILIFLISLLVLTWVVKILLLGRIVKAVVSNKSIWYFRWLIFDYLWSLVNFFLLHILSGTIWLNFIYRCFGASIGEGTFIEKPCIRVPDLVHIGSNTYISGEATILCVNENPDSSAFGTVRIGNGSVIQSRAFLDINVIIGNQVEVCPLTHIAPDTKVQSGSRVSGTLAQIDKIDHELLHNVSSSQIDAKGGFYVGLVTPVIICILYGALLGAFIFSFEPIYLATEEDLGISVVIYLACGPLIVVVATFMLCPFVWIVRRVLLKGHLHSSKCHVHSVDFARRWLAKQIFEYCSVLLPKHSVFKRIYIRLLGGRICVFDSFAPTPMEPDLFTSNEGIFAANGVVIRSFKVDITGVATFDNICMGRDAVILDRSVIMPGVMLEDNVTVGSGTVVEGNVPEGSLIFGNPPLIRHRGAQGKDEATLVRKALYIIIEEVLTTLLHLLLGRLPRLAIFAAMLAANPFGFGLHIAATVCSSFFVAIMIVFATIASKWTIIRDFRDFGTAHFFSWKIQRWVFMFEAVHYLKVVIEGINDFRITRLVLNLLGANIDKDAYLVGSVLVLEADLLTVGSGSNVHKEVTLFGHKFQNGKLELSTIRVGNDCEIGSMSIILPGSDIGNSVTVKPLTQVMPGERLSDKCVYGGSPMEWLGVREPNRTSISIHRSRVRTRGSLEILQANPDVTSVNEYRSKYADVFECEDMYEGI